MPTAVDITGERYGRLVALGFAGHLRIGSQPKRAFRFQCDCGNVVVRTLMDVRRLDTMSCGCHKRDLARAWGERSRLAEGESSFRSLFYTYRRHARTLSLPFELTEEGFRGLTSASCYYCNTEPVQRKKATAESHGVYRYNGIDRLDSTKGYVAGNVVSCCGPCNRAKGATPVHEFLDWVRRVYMWKCHEG